MNEIIEFTYRPKTEPKRVVPTLAALLIASSALVVLSVTSPLYKGVISLFAVIGITASLYLFTRYCAGDYIYSVARDSLGQAVFTVSRVIGKRSSLMCCMHLTNFVSINAISSADYKKRVSARGVKKYNFHPSFAPDSFYLISVKSVTEESEIIVDITEEVRLRLIESVQIAKSTEPEE